MRSNNRRRGSMLIVSLLFATLIVHASIEAHPLWRRVVERSYRHEREYRQWRMNDGLRRYRLEMGHYPPSLESLLAAEDHPPFVPRIYGDPETGQTSWEVVRDDEGAIRAVKARAEGRNERSARGCLR